MKDYELKVGDYFCADGNLVSRDCKPEEVPDNCIGIVYYVGNPQPSVMYKDIEEVAEQPLTTKIKDGARDVLKRDYPNCVHGLVFALSSANATAAARFGSSSSFAYYQTFVNKGLDETYLWWHTDQPKNAVNFNVETDLFCNGLLGYNNTEVLYIINDMATTPLGGCQDMFNVQLIPYRTQVSTPDNLSTEWYLPSLGELRIISDNKEVINSSLEKIAGAEQLWAVGGKYWSSTYNANGYMWVGGNTGVFVASGGHVKNGKEYFRFSLAF